MGKIADATNNEDTHTHTHTYIYKFFCWEDEHNDISNAITMNEQMLTVQNILTTSTARHAHNEDIQNESKEIRFSLFIYFCQYVNVTDWSDEKTKRKRNKESKEKNRPVYKRIQMAIKCKMSDCNQISKMYDDCD